MNEVKSPKKPLMYYYLLIALLVLLLFNLLAMPWMLRAPDPGGGLQHLRHHGGEEGDRQGGDSGAG